jgi:hypothetical protein
MASVKGIAKLTLSRDKVEALHPDCADWDYGLVAAQGGGLSRYIGGYDTEEEVVAFYEVYKAHQFVRTLNRIKGLWELDIEFEEFTGRGCKHGNFLLGHRV